MTEDEQVTVPLAALRALAKEATLVASGFDELIPHDTHFQSKIADLIDALGVEGL